MTKKSSFLTMITLCLLAILVASCGTKSSVEKFIKQYEVALNSKDADKLEKFYDTPSLVTSSAYSIAILDSFAQGGIDIKSKLDITDIKITRASATVDTVLSIIYKADDETTTNLLQTLTPPSNVRITLKKKNGKWKIINEQTL